MNFNSNNINRPNIIVIGNCSCVIDKIQDNLDSSLDVDFIDSNLSGTLNELLNLKVDNNTVAMFLCCGILNKETDINRVSFLHEKFPYIPIFPVLDDQIDRIFLHKLYKAGITNSIYSPKDNLDIEIINSKIKSILDSYNYKKQLSCEKMKNTQYFISLNANMKTYIELLDLMKLSYVILDPHGEILENNCHFNNIMKKSDLHGLYLEEFIAEESIETYHRAFENMHNGEAAEDIEIKLFKQEQKYSLSAWIRINGNSIDYNGQKIIIVAKDITNKKITEHTQYIQNQKKRDLIKQNLIALRQELKKPIFTIEATQ